MNNRSLSQNIVFIGIDVHKSKNVLCAIGINEEKVNHFKTVITKTKEILTYVEKLKELYGPKTKFIFGYEAGPTGVSLKRDLNLSGYECRILPLHYVTPFKRNSRIKTDKRDAEAIAQTLKSGRFYEVYTPDEEDESVKSYLRMRDLKSETVKRNKQQILSFVLSKGYVYSRGEKTTKKSYWTHKHRSWLKDLDLKGIDKLTLKEMLSDLTLAEQGLERVDKKIQEIAQSEKYKKHVDILRGFIGFDYLTALSFIVEIGDFERFETPGQLASFLGLVPGEHSTGNKHQKTGMTKAGNKELRRKTILAAQCVSRHDPSRKSRNLLEKQRVLSADLLAYIDKAHWRMTDKFKRLVYAYGKPRNIGIGAIARELVNFVWGAMTGHIA